MLPPAGRREKLFKSALILGILSARKLKFSLFFPKWRVRKHVPASKPRDPNLFVPSAQLSPSPPIALSWENATRVARAHVKQAKGGVGEEEAGKKKSLDCSGMMEKG